MRSVGKSWLFHVQNFISDALTSTIASTTSTSKATTTSIPVTDLVTQTTVESTTELIVEPTEEPGKKTTAETTTAFTTFSSGDRLVPKWSDWSPFSECSATCGGGTKTKTRLCSVQNACPGVDSKMGFIEVIFVAVYIW